MRSRWFHRPLLHSPAAGVEKRATWLELFYDLIFVAAFIQLGNGLAAHVTPRGFVVFAGAFVSLWVAWSGFTFFENRFTLDDFLHRSVVLLKMFAVGAVAISAPRVLDGDLAAFALACGCSQLAIAFMHLRAYRQVPEASDYAKFWGLSFLLSALSWLVSPLLPPGLDVGACVLATALVLASPASSQSRSLTERFPIDFEHLTERYGLLTIIVLGESFVKVLSSLALEPAGLSLYLEAGVVLVLTCGVWWVYFDDVAGSHVRRGPLHWVVWLYAHVPLQLGIVMLAVALKKAVAFSWNEPAPSAYRYLLAGSLALVYLGVSAIDSVTERRQAELGDRARVNARWLSSLLLLVLAPAGSSMSGATFLGIVVAINVGHVAFDMMMAPFEATEHIEVGQRSTAELARDRAGQPRRRRPPDVSTAVRKGAPSNLRRDLYFYLIEGSWPRVGVVFGAVYLLTNTFFAALYSLEPGSVSGSRGESFADAFFFSVQTLSTIGFGSLSPATTFGNVVVTVEAAVGVFGVAIVTGLTFAKVSRPRSAALFSKPLVVTTLHGQRVLMFRVGNARGNDIVDASISLSVLRDELSPEGHHIRRVQDLKLVRRRQPMFVLSWSVMHVLDDDSPLRDVDWKAPGGAIVGLIATLTGHDGTYGQTTYARHSYAVDDIRLGHRFVDILHELEDGRLMLDYTQFHATEAEPPAKADSDAAAKPPPP